METIVIDYTLQINQLIENQEHLLQHIETLETAILQLNGYFYLLIFLLAGVGMFYLFYKFLKIFL